MVPATVNYRKGSFSCLWQPMASHYIHSQIAMEVTHMKCVCGHLLRMHQFFGPPDICMIADCKCLQYNPEYEDEDCD